MTNRTQVALVKNTVERCYPADDAVSVPLHKSLHDAPPIESANPIMRLASWGACFIWLRLCCAVLQRRAHATYQRGPLPASPLQAIVGHPGRINWPPTSAESL